MEKMRIVYKILVGNLKGKYHSEELGVFVKTIIRMYLREIWWKL
jgi:hypothetical protein